MNSVLRQMIAERYTELAARFPALHVGILGDFCLDRYFEIDPVLAETSIETGREVHNVVRVRGQPGGAGTVLNNLAALGVGRITPLGFCGDDGEGFELRRALAQRPGVDLSRFITTELRRTFTYGKPLVVEPGRVPVELNRLDIKNWSPTPPELEHALIAGLDAIADSFDALIVLDQVDRAETGVVTRRVLEAVERLACRRERLLILADGRRGLAHFPKLGYKMNARELAQMTPLADEPSLADIQLACRTIARRTSHPAFVTLAERGIVGASPDGAVHHADALPVRGPIDIVGAGDAVTANLAASLAAGASLSDALAIAMAAASLVIHQLGTTGTAGVAQIRELLPPGPGPMPC
jgi:bifunctional ADP-heptose synthase (sugar kinase/adenylyltransferase)